MIFIKRAKEIWWAIIFIWNIETFLELKVPLKAADDFLSGFLFCLKNSSKEKKPKASWRLWMGSCLGRGKSFTYSKDHFQPFSYQSNCILALSIFDFFGEKFKFIWIWSKLKLDGRKGQEYHHPKWKVSFILLARLQWLGLGGRLCKNQGQIQGQMDLKGIQLYQNLTVLDFVLFFKIKRTALGTHFEFIWIKNLPEFSILQFF